MKYLLAFLTFIFFGLELNGQSILQLIKSKPKQTQIPELELLELNTTPQSQVDLSTGNMKFTQDSTLKNSTELKTYFNDLISVLMNNKTSKEDSIRMKKVIDSLGSETIKYYNIALDYLNKIYQIKGFELAEYISNNGKLSRECEINYYLLEDKLKDLKMMYTNELKSNGNFRDSVDRLLNELYLSWFEIETLKDSFKLLGTERDKILGVNLNLDTNLENLFSKSKSLQKFVDSAVIHLNRYYKVLKTRIESTMKTTQKDELGLSASPVLNSFANKFSPSLSILGTANYGKTYNELGLFTGGLFGKNSSLMESFYYHDLSDFAIYYKGAAAAIVSVDSNQKAGFNYEAYFMNKQFGGDSMRKIDAFAYTSIQLKAGFEYVVYRDVVSAYANLNYHLPISNLRNLQLVTGREEINQINFDLGVKMILSPSQKNNGSTNLFVDINLMFLNDKMKNVLAIQDDILPSLKIGIQQRLSKF